MHFKREFQFQIQFLCNRYDSVVFSSDSITIEKFGLMALIDDKSITKWNLFSNRNKIFNIDTKFPLFGEKIHKIVLPRLFLFFFLI